MRRQRGRYRGLEPAEVNVTAFLGLMVVLVPFLLTTSVFSQLVAVDLEFSQESGDQNLASAREAPVLVTVRGDRIELTITRGDPPVIIENTAGVHDLDSVRSFLVEVKSKAEDRVDATILMDPDLSYDTLIRVMDTVRSHFIQGNGAIVRRELFPRIAVGDAPQQKGS